MAKKPESSKGETPKQAAKPSAKAKKPEKGETEAPKRAAKVDKVDKVEKAEKAEKLAPARLKERYVRDVMPVLMEEFKYPSVMRVPRLEKVVISIGLGEAIQNPKALESAQKDLGIVAGQHAVITRARKSIASFKLRTGMPIGAKVTLRDRRMYEFLDRLINSVLPRIRDFRGVSKSSFDGRGNYSLGMKDQLVFPEIDYDKVDKPRGLEVTIVTTAPSDEEGRRLLELLGMPFVRG
jgi:large subunit ribosomal protein L5